MSLRVVGVRAITAYSIMVRLAAKSRKGVWAFATVPVVVEAACVSRPAAGLVALVALHGILAGLAALGGQAVGLRRVVFRVLGEAHGWDTHLLINASGRPPTY